jgi:hypothetical protein
VTTFVLRQDATAAGTFGGDVSFATNDPDEGTFNFAVSGAVSPARVIDDGGAGFSVSGTRVGVMNAGYHGDARRIAPADLAAHGVKWEDLGTFTAAGALSVRMSNQANGWVIADAVRIERVDTPAAQANAGVPAAGRLPVDRRRSVYEMIVNGSRVALHWQSRRIWPRSRAI